MSIFICGATGTQGGAIIHHLLNKGLTIKAITRDLTSPTAKALLNAGVILTQGNYDNEETLQTALKDCTSLFLNLMPSFTDPNHEFEQAKKILSIAKQAGVKQVIYSSAFGVNQPELFDPSSFVGKVLLGKKAIENHVRDAGFEHWTVLRPGNFMSNFLLPNVLMYGGLVETGRYTTAWTKDTVLPMVDPNDIGQFGAAAVLDPVRFNQKEIEIASELMTVNDVMLCLSKAAGKDLQAVYLTDKEIEEQSAQNPLIDMQVMMRGMARFVDMESLKAWKIELGSFEQFLEREKERVEQTYIGLP
ncbi:hypothetical protein ASPWEDRAFT_34289 [Aspergillus wentii DTO 134E9]|uniref:NmrA-like domain-containing protein n=1 Tax=Aspergillus wentii DTO 134E9 TaxID=1073089 RepID=A0A1L9S0W1_ASPWE|nr:uncharacterized protein ASPWEDRAFT_34289 [Aspergillus wentii DTO 134E9]KAI9931186.1 hypothetical protein MW887_010846 [Aspergillus wentii]OJJ40806.1 hypothetical protein ASPWEDRAFT_34289 [Aspergillus wentii DTO 134E9]